MFQSLIHQGKNARQKRGKRKESIMENVSIPYSSGEKCKRDETKKARASLVEQFQSLIHQGKNARICIMKFEQLYSGSVSIPYSSGEKCKTCIFSK